MSEMNIEKVRELLGLSNLYQWELDQKLMSRCIQISCSVGSPSNRIRLGSSLLGLVGEEDFLQKWTLPTELYLVPKAVHQGLGQLAEKCRQVWAPSSPYVIRLMPGVGQNSPKCVLFGNFPKANSRWTSAVAALGKAVGEALAELPEYKLELEAELRDFFRRVNQNLPEGKRLDEETIETRVAVVLSKVPSEAEVKANYHTQVQFGWTPEYGPSYEEDLRGTLEGVDLDEADLMEALFGDIVNTQQNLAAGMLEDTLRKVYGTVKEETGTVLQRIVEKGVVGSIKGLEEVVEIVGEVAPSLFAALGGVMDVKLGDRNVQLKMLLAAEKRTPESVAAVLAPMFDRAAEILEALGDG